MNAEDGGWALKDTGTGGCAFHVHGSRRRGGAAGRWLKPLPESRADKRWQPQSVQPEQWRLNMGSHCHHLSPETAGKLLKQLIYHGKGGSETDCINTPRGLLLFPLPPATQEGGPCCLPASCAGLSAAGGQELQWNIRKVTHKSFFREAKFTWRFWEGLWPLTCSIPHFVPLQAASVTAAPTDVVVH